MRVGSNLILKDGFVCQSHNWGLYRKIGTLQTSLNALSRYRIDEINIISLSYKKNEDFISTLFHCVLDHVDWADDLIKSHLQNWEFNRVAQVDKVLLRMGICEIFYLDDIPPKVSISEMVEISKVYSTDESSGFINGILDAVYKDYQQQENN